MSMFACRTIVVFGAVWIALGLPVRLRAPHSTSPEARSYTTKSCPRATAIERPSGDQSSSHPLLTPQPLMWTE